MVRCPACPNAIARIKGGADAPHLSGEVRFYQECGNVLVVADISGLPSCGGTGFFALHIHEGGSVADFNMFITMQVRCDFLCKEGNILLALFIGNIGIML